MKQTVEATNAVFPGSFDPPTEGHINIIERGLKLFDKVIVAVAVNSSKKGLLSAEERIGLLKEIFRNQSTVEIDSFQDRLLVDYVRSKKAKAILRGLRTVQDYEYEFQMALSNKNLAPDIETIFIMTEAAYSHLSSSLIKEILFLGGPGKGLVPPVVEKKLREKLTGKRKTELSEVPVKGQNRDIGEEKGQDNERETITK